MTVNELFRKIQLLKLDGCGEYTVMINDLTDEPPVPQPAGSVKILRDEKKVFIQSKTLAEIVSEG